MNQRDPDDMLVVTFRHHPVPNKLKSEEAGRLVCDDMEVCDIRAPGSRNYPTQPAHMRSRWEIDPFSGEQREVTYAERFKRQYDQWKAQAQQTKTGTPLTYAQFLTEGKRAELRAQNIYTVEQLAGVEGQELKNLGMGGRDLKNLAAEYITEAKTGAPNLQLEAELEAERLKAKMLQEDNEMLKARLIASGEAEFQDMSDDQLIAYIKAHTGYAPQGNLPRKSLVQMAVGARPSRAAS